MTVTEALKLINSTPRDAVGYYVRLACGFTPLHLQTFLAAYTQRQLPGRRVQITGGLYGDIAGTLEKPEDTPPDGLAIALEWSDLDPRLGYRGSGAWGPSALPDIMASARTMLDRIAGATVSQPAGVRIALSLPTLSLPPVFHQPGWQASQAELLLSRDLFEFATSVAGRATVVNAQRLNEESPPASRLDLKSDLLVGLPYSLNHADAMGSALARLLAPPAPKKGIISDLDNTLWYGIAGEVGPENVSWDLASHRQLHGLYQKLLAALSERGILVGIASKNDPETVRKVFERPDLLLKSDRVFPIEAHWDAKSGSVAKILSTWNIAADSVIFVDDSPMELAEVAAAHPGIECIRFPENDYAEGCRMLWRLQDLCGKESISGDDAIRLDSIRKGVVFRDSLAAGAAPDDFLKAANATISFDFRVGPNNIRALELLNKTNQFNLNGIRYTEPDWVRELALPESFAVAVGYEDKYGPLGTIAVLLLRRHNKRLKIISWVMSCRAFSRRIEYQCLRVLFGEFEIEGVDLNFAPTAKNGPLQDFLTALGGSARDSSVSVELAQFDAACPALYHKVITSREN